MEEKDFITIKGEKYYTGDLIRCKIDGSEINAELELTRSNFYLHQNLYRGASSGYKSSYFMFSYVINRDSSSDLYIIRHLTEDEVSGLKIQYKYRVSHEGINNLLYWKQEAYPACCGSDILCEFTKMIGYRSTIKTLTEEDYKNIKSNFANFSKGLNYIAILQEELQNGEIELLEKIGFKKVDSFINPNSGRNLILLSYVRSK